MKHFMQWLFFGALLLSFVTCTKPLPDDIEKTKFEKQLSEMKNDLETKEAMVKDPGLDPGSKGALSEEIELLKSRMDRLRAKVGASDEQSSPIAH